MDRRYNGRISAFTSLLILLACFAGSLKAQDASLFSEITVSNGKTFTLGTLQLGEDVFIDRTHSIQVVPDGFYGATVIRGSNDDKNIDLAEGYVKFAVTRNVTMHVAYDARVLDAIPAWLEEWENLEVTIGTSDTNYMLFAKDFAEGDTVNIGGPRAAPQTGSANGIFFVADDGGSAPVALELGDEFIFFAAGGNHVLTPRNGIDIVETEGSDGQPIRAARFERGSFAQFESFGRTMGFDLAQNQQQADTIYIKFKSSPLNLEGAPPRLTLIDRPDNNGIQFRLWYTFPEEVHDDQWHELAIPMPTITSQAAFDSAVVGLNVDGTPREEGALSEDESRWEYWGAWANSPYNRRVESSTDELWREYKFNDISGIGMFWEQADNNPFGPVFIEHLYVGDSSTDVNVASTPPAPFTDFNVNAGTDSLTISWTPRDDISAYNIYYSGADINSLDDPLVNYIATITDDFEGTSLSIPISSPHPLDPTHTYNIVMAASNNWGVPNDDVSASVASVEAEGTSQSYIMRLTEEDETQLIANLEGGVAAPAARMAEIAPFEIKADEGFTSLTYEGDEDISAKVWMGFGTAEGAKTLYMYAEVTDDAYGVKDGENHGVTVYPTPGTSTTWIPGIRPNGAENNGFFDDQLQWNYYIMDQLKIHFGTYMLDNFVSGSTHALPERGTEPDYYFSIQPYKTEVGNEELPVGVLTRMWMREANTTDSDASYMSAYYATQHPMTFPPVHENIVEDGVYKGWKVLVAIDALDLLAVVDGGGNPVDAEMQFPEEGEIGYWPMMFELVDYDDERDRTGNWWETPDMMLFHPTKAAGFGVSINNPDYRMLPAVALGDAVITSVEDQLEIPLSFNLEQNYPNPFNPTTAINFTLPQAAEVRLDVFNMLGQRVANLVTGQTMSAGNHTINFNAAQLSTGVYIYRLQAGGNTMTRKMTLIR